MQSCYNQDKGNAGKGSANVKNSVLEKYRQGQPVIGTITHLKSPTAVEAIGAAGMDYVLLDMEHCPMDMGDVQHGVTATYPEGGLFLWVTLPEGMDAKALSKKATARKVAYVPGAPFYPNGGHGNHLRLNFSTMQEDRIVEGIKLLGQLLREELDA